MQPFHNSHDTEEEKSLDNFFKVFISAALISQKKNSNSMLLTNMCNNYSKATMKSPYNKTTTILVPLDVILGFYG